MHVSTHRDRVYSMLPVKKAQKAHRIQSSLPLVHLPRISKKMMNTEQSGHRLSVESSAWSCQSWLELTVKENERKSECSQSVVQVCNTFVNMDICLSPKENKKGYYYYLLLKQKTHLNYCNCADFLFLKSQIEHTELRCKTTSRKRSKCVVRVDNVNYSLMLGIADLYVTIRSLWYPGTD